MRILLVSQMYPGPADPDLGVFVERLGLALRERGHELDLAVIDRRAGGKRRYLELLRDARAAARRHRPDVVYAHFLVPAGLIASLATDAPLVVTAHGQDVRNIGSIRGVRAATRRVVRRAAAVVAVSDYLRRELEAKAARGARQDRGRGLRRRPRALPRRAARARRRPCVSLRRLARRPQERAPARARLRAARGGDADLRRRRAAARAARGPAGDRPRRARPARRDPAVDRAGRRRLRAEPRRAVRRRPCSRRSPAGGPVVATRIGGPAGVRPARSRGAGRPDRRGARSPTRCAPPPPCPFRTRPPGPRPRRTTSGCRRLGWRRSCCEPLEVGQPDLDERPHLLLEPGLLAPARAPARSSRAPSRARRPASAGCRR